MVLRGRKPCIGRCRAAMGIFLSIKARLILSLPSLIIVYSGFSELYSQFLNLLPATFDLGIPSCRPEKGTPISFEELRRTPNHIMCILYWTRARTMTRCPTYEDDEVPSMHLMLPILTVSILPASSRQMIFTSKASGMLSIDA